MSRHQKILAIIPARGGSKGLPGKNIKELCGKPLIAWTIQRALESQYISEVFVTTDSQEIADVSEKYGVLVPELRPSELASDTASSMDVIEYVINYYENRNQFFDYIILLEPTSPLRKVNDIDDIISLALDNQEADGVISVGEVHMEHPSIVKRINDKGYIEKYVTNSNGAYQRQMLDKAYFPYGVSYLIKTSVFKDFKAIYTEKMMPYYIERWQCYEIDDIYDFECIKTIMKMENFE